MSSYTKPIAGVTAGYASEVIFADGTFIDGSTSELSCDGPLREPFCVFCQVLILFFLILYLEIGKVIFMYNIRVALIGLNGDLFLVKF